MSKELVEAIASLLYPPLSPEAAREKARAALSAIEREGWIIVRPGVTSDVWSSATTAIPKQE